MRTLLRTLLWAAFLLPLLAPPSGGARVTLLSASHHDGQTFLTWAAPAGTGWKYRVYASDGPIPTGTDLLSATPLGEVGDSTWYDRRLSTLRGSPYAFTTDSLAPPLAPTQGLFVHTVPSDGARFYAVTARQGADPEDTTLVAGENTLATAVPEVEGRPRPVFQRTVYEWVGPVDIYTLWVGNVDTPHARAMANRPSMAHDCGVVRGGAPPTNALMVCTHWHGGDFLAALGGSGAPGEWRLGVDDFIPNADNNTFYHGYHQDYDILSNANPVPTSGMVADYTMRRVEFTVEWARATLPVDLLRTYVMGISMGGSCALFLGWERPDLVAAAWAVLPKVDFSTFEWAGFLWQGQLSAQWGSRDTDLLGTDGLHVYDRLNSAWMAARHEAPGTPPVFTFSGKLDYYVGWTEKIAYYRSMGTHRQGGTFFWDWRGHTLNATAYWSPMQNARYLYRFRTDLSFPAISMCSADGNPGNGRFYNGDSTGTINGFAEWDTAIVDSATRWEVVLRPRDLVSFKGPVPAPDSFTVNVTPRRLQRFVIAPGMVFRYTESRVSDGVVTATGMTRADTLGLVTLYGAMVRRGGTRLTLEPSNAAAEVGSGGAADRRRIRIAPFPNPLRGRAALEVTWPTAGAARVDVISVDGRTVRTLANGRAAAGGERVTMDANGLAPGVYWLAARQGAESAARKLVIIR
ncbi:MAG: hypothetical protein HZB25_04295 [Candidatus Eisenbacteria bacterium]|nr:hypothetical protein [Candidatus Eisenbacteria bacterium]